MKKITEYTTQEIDLLCRSRIMIDRSYMSIIVFKHTINWLMDAQITKESMLESPIFSTTLNKKFDTIEPFGEGKYFVILDNILHTHRFEFWTRHLNNFLFKATLKEMPLLINTPFVSELAKWRLTIAK